MAASSWHPVAAPPLFFLHIPKTAGTNVREFLDSQYRAELICPGYWRRDFDRLDNLQDYRLFRGHADSSFKKALPADIKVMTFLRHPVYRTLSEVRHIARSAELRATYPWVADWSIPRLLRDERFMLRMRDRHAAMLSGRWPSHLPADLDQAVETLSRMDFFGVTEDLQNSLNALSVKLGLHPQIVSRDPNRAPEGATEAFELTAADRALLEDYNRQDIALYYYALGRLAAQPQQTTREQALAAVFAGGKWPVVDGDATLDLRAPIPGSGWYRAYPGQIQRWTGPAPVFTLEVALAPERSYLLTMAMRPAAPGNFTGFSVQANGVDADFDHRREGGAIQLRVRLPRALVSRNPAYCELVFRHAAVSRPEPCDATGARPPAGFIVREIAFAPQPGT